MPPDVKQELAASLDGLQCVCGHWMQKMLCSECYPGSSSISCDFSGDTIEGTEVWHCPANKDSPMHPLGCDVDVANTESYREFGVMLRLEERLTRLLDEVLAAEGKWGLMAEHERLQYDCKVKDLQARRVDLVQGMISPLLEAYNIQKQVSSGLYVVQREGDKQWATRLKV